MIKLYYANCHNDTGRVEYFIAAKSRDEVKDIIVKRFKYDWTYLISDDDIDKKKYKTPGELLDTFCIVYFGIAAKSIKKSGILRMYCSLLKHDFGNGEADEFDIL